MNLYFLFKGSEIHKHYKSCELGSNISHSLDNIGVLGDNIVALWKISDKIYQEVFPRVMSTNTVMPF